MRRWISGVVILVVTGLSALPANACDNSPELARVPGASDADAEKRYLSYEDDLGVIARFENEKAALETSWAVYLAKVANVERGNAEDTSKEISVAPVWPVRGILPKGQQRITLGADKRMCSARGSLSMDSLETGSLVVIFEGPASKYGMSAESARTGELINAITMYALKVDPNQFK